MARAIDLDVALDRYYAEYERQDICDGSQDRDWLMRCLEEAPTLTTPNEWVSVKERLPENNCRVLVHVTGKPFDIDADRLADGKWVRWGWCVTHWMPLPEPPKEYNHAV